MEIKRLHVRKVMYMYVTKHGGIEKWFNVCSSRPYCSQQKLKASLVPRVYSKHPKSVKTAILCHVVQYTVVTSTLRVEAVFAGTHW